LRVSPFIRGTLLVAGVPLFAFLLTEAGLGIKSAFIAAACWWTMVVLAAAAMSNLLRYYRPPRGREWQFLAWTLALSLLPMAAVFPARMLAPDPALEALISQTTGLRWFLSVLLPGTAGLFVWVRREASRRLEQQEYLREAEKLNRETALQALKSQMHPHFLFNSLNSIHALIGSRPDDARKMTENLSDYLRMSLQNEPHTLLNLEQEIAYTQLYLRVESWRFGHRLEVLWDIPDSLRDFPVPAMLLQPLVENAIKFGLYGNEGRVRVEIAMRAAGDSLRIRITNPLPADNHAGTKGTGFGLRSLQRRLRLFYGAGQWLQTKQQDGYFTVSIQLPPQP
jgi:hypothetical protein